MARKRGVRVAVLIEDQTLERFVRQILLCLGFSRHELRVLPFPVGKGSAKAWVDLQYAAEVKILRSKNFQPNLALLVGTDADELTVDQRNQDLATSLADRSLPPRGDGENIIHLIPKWNIETWLLYFAGKPRDENRDYKHEVKKTDFPAVAAAFVSEFRRHAQGEQFESQPSLIVAYGEMRRLDV